MEPEPSEGGQLTEQWRAWLRASRPNLPDWPALIGPRAREWERARADALGGPRVLIANSVPGSAAHAMFEAVVAVALTLRGASVRILTCDQQLPACFRAEFPEVSPDTLAELAFGADRVCRECPQVGAHQFGFLGLPHSRYGNHLAPADRERARALAARSTLDEIEGFETDGVRIGEHAVAGAIRYYASGSLAGQPRGEEVLRRFFEGALLSAAAIRGHLEGARYQSCLLHHGVYSPQGIVAETCRARGLRTNVWHVAYRKGCFLVSPGDTYHRTMLTEPVAAWEGLAWSDRLEAELQSYLKSRWRGTSDWIWFHEKPEEDVERICREIGADLSRPTVGLLTNVMWDAQLHYRTNAFPSMLEWVLASIEHFARRRDLQLLIRVHPAEIRGTLPSRQKVAAEIAQRWPRLPENVFLIPPESNVSTYAAMLQCDSVLVYATKTGVELAALGMPVVVAGEAWIRDKGFSLDASSPAEYEQILGRLPLRRRLDPDRWLRAKKYAYHFFFRRMIPVRSFAPAPDGWPPYTLAIDDLLALSPGRDPGLDLICDGILSGRPFVFPAESVGHPS